MNPEQAMNREERVAIMTICGNQTEEVAQAYCDTKPDVYGIRDFEETQGGLF